MLFCEQLIKFKLFDACLTNLQVLETGKEISKRISPLKSILALHKHYEKKKKNQKIRQGMHSIF